MYVGTSVHSDIKIVTQSINCGKGLYHSIKQTSAGTLKDNILVQDMMKVTVSFCRLKCGLVAGLFFLERLFAIIAVL